MDEKVRARIKTVIEHAELIGARWAPYGHSHLGHTAQDSLLRCFHWLADAESVWPDDVLGFGGIARGGITFGVVAHTVYLPGISATEMEEMVKNFGLPRPVRWSVNT